MILHIGTPRKAGEAARRKTGPSTGRVWRNLNRTSSTPDSKSRVYVKTAEAVRRGLDESTGAHVRVSMGDSAKKDGEQKQKKTWCDAGMDRCVAASQSCVFRPDVAFRAIRLKFELRPGSLLAVFRSFWNGQSQICRLSPFPSTAVLAPTH